MIALCPLRCLDLDRWPIVELASLINLPLTLTLTKVHSLLLQLEIKTNKSYKGRSKLGCHENLRPLEFFVQKRIYMVKLSPCAYHGLFYGHAMFIGNRQKEARYFDSICWRIYYRRNRRHRVAMLFKLKSVFYPPDATTINRRR